MNNFSESNDALLKNKSQDVTMDYGTDSSENHMLFKKDSQGSIHQDNGYYVSPMVTPMASPMIGKPPGRRSIWRADVTSSSIIRNFVNRSLRFRGKLHSSRHHSGNATILNEIFNLVKNIVGCGVLSLPSGIAAFSSSKSISVIISATTLIFAVGAIFCYYFLLIGRICKNTCTFTYKEAWEETVGKFPAFVALCNLIKPAMGNLSYSIILADTLKRLLASVDVIVSREHSLLFSTIFILLPLCMMKNIKVLTPFSILGIVGMLTTAVSMAWRYFDGSYVLSNEGNFVRDVPESLRPKFEVKSGQVSILSYISNMLVLACMLFEAFVAHYNSPRFYTELKDNTVKRFAIVCISSFAISSFFYSFIAIIGFMTFGENCDGYILNNYAITDNVANICRTCIFIAVVCSYPIVFIGFRDGVLDFLSVPIEKQTGGNLNFISLILLSIITMLASSFSDLGLVNAIGGGTLGCIIVFVFPTLMFATCNEDFEGSMKKKTFEIGLSYILMAIGVIMGFIGVMKSIYDS